MISIRPASPGDLPAVVDLWKREGGPTRHAGQLAEAQVLLGRDPEALIVAERDEDIIGSLIVGWDGWRCHVYRLAVEPAARRAGVARQLVQAGAERAKRLGAARIDAMVDPDNSGAIAFWESVGFELDIDRRWSVFLGESR